MTAEQRQSVVVLQGQVNTLFPVLFLTGGPQAGPGPYSSLALMLELAPGATRHTTWALASLQDPQESFDLARRTAARPGPRRPARSCRRPAPVDAQEIEQRGLVPDLDAELAGLVELGAGRIEQGRSRQLGVLGIGNIGSYPQESRPVQQQAKPQAGPADAKA